MVDVMFAEMLEQLEHMIWLNLKSKYYTLDADCKNQKMGISVLWFVGGRLETTALDICRLYCSIAYVSKLFTVSLTGAARDICIILHGGYAYRMDLLCIYVVSMLTLLQ
jgi:hypothetical protein